MPNFAVKCPRCSRRASAVMREAGAAGTYREPAVRWAARRIVCSRCGFNVTSDQPLPYELWYKVTVRGRTAWARDSSHAAFLVAYLLNRLRSSDVDAASVETLPGWMIEAGSRQRIARAFQRLLDAD